MPTNVLHEALSKVDPPPSVAVIRPLIAQNPEHLMEKENRHGRTPLFYFIFRYFEAGVHISTDVVYALIDACPDAVLECDVNGELPMQRALLYRLLDIARALVNANPACLKLLDNAGGLPLHVAVQNAVDIKTFNLILQGFPEACTVKDSENIIPLQWALRRRHTCAFEVIEALVRAFPDSLKIKYLTRGPFLFHKICERSQMTEQFIRFVKDNCPEVFLLPGGDGYLPLHCAMDALCIAGQAADQTAALAMICACPEAARVGSASGRLPLHLISSYIPIVVVKALVDAYPDAVVTKCRTGRTPLHALLGRTQNDPLEVVKVLATARPEVISVKDDEYGDTLLATAVRRGVNLPTVEWLIDALPDSIKVANNDLHVPLHIASSRGRRCSVEVVRAVYQAWPDSVKQRDSDGRIPLALAVVRNAPQEVVDFLLEVSSESARSKDNQGRIPLHDAVIDNNLELARVLVGAWSEGLQETDTGGNIPLFLACESLENDKMVKLLLEAWPDSIRFANMDGDLVMHTAARRLRFCYAEERLSENKAFISRAKYLIDARPESLLEQNRKGKLPLHVLLEYESRIPINSQLDMVRLFVDRCRESVEVADADGNIPLFTARKSNAITVDVIDFLTRASLNILLSSQRR